MLVLPLGRVHVWNRHKQLRVTYHLITLYLFNDATKRVQIRNIFFHFVVLGRNCNATDGHHLPLKGAELFIGLNSIQIGDGGVGGSGVQVEIFTQVQDPFRYNRSQLYAHRASERGNIKVRYCHKGCLYI